MCMYIACDINLSVFQSLIVELRPTTLLVLPIIGKWQQTKLFGAARICRCFIISASIECKLILQHATHRDKYKHIWETTWNDTRLFGVVEIRLMASSVNLTGMSSMGWSLILGKWPSFTAISLSCHHDTGRRVGARDISPRCEADILVIWLTPKSG